MYLDYFRERIIDKVTSLPLDAMIVSVVPTDWTALELVRHLTYVEMRWLEWGFEGQSVDEPWGDHLGERWFVGPDDTLDSLVEALRTRGVQSGEIVRRHDLDELGLVVGNAALWALPIGSGVGGSPFVLAFGADLEIFVQFLVENHGVTGRAFGPQTLGNLTFFGFGLAGAELGFLCERPLGDVDRRRRQRRRNHHPWLRRE